MRATDEQLDDAKRVLRADYWQSVRDLADQVREAAKAGEFTDMEGADEYLRETVDGSYWVTYTHAALQVLCWTEHDDAIFDDLGPGEWSDASTAYTQIAYYALLADIMDQLGNLDNLFENLPIRAGNLCPACELDDLAEDGADSTLLVCENCGLEARVGDTEAEALGRRR